MNENPLVLLELDESQQPALVFLRDNFQLLKFTFQTRIWACKNQPECFNIAVINLWKDWNNKPPEEWHDFNAFDSDAKFKYVLTALLNQGRLILGKCQSCNIKFVSEEDCEAYQENTFKSPYENAEILEFVELARRKIGQSDFKILELDTNGYTSEEIAKETGISPTNVRKRKQRALEKLREFFASILN